MSPIIYIETYTTIPYNTISETVARLKYTVS